MLMLLQFVISILSIMCDIALHKTNVWGIDIAQQ